MALNKTQKSEIVNHFKRGELDTGSSEVQIALITFQIKDLTGHFKRHPKDNHGTVGLVKLVNRRRRLLDYLKRTDLPKYQKLIADLGIRK